MRLLSRLKANKVATASSWVIVGHFISQLIRLGGNLVLTRLLVPEMFGVMALVSVLITGVTMLSDIGLGQSIIQNKRGSEPDFLNTAWTLQIIRGFLLWLIICFFAGVLWVGNHWGYLSHAQAYAHPLLPWLIITAGFAAVVSGFNSTKVFQAKRELALGKIEMIHIIVQLISLLTIITLAYHYKTIWSIVAGSIVGSVINMFFSHKYLPGIKNKIHWDKSAVHELFHFGKWIFLSTAVGFIANQGDRLILGGLLTPEMLGIYSIAFMLANLPSSIVSQLSHKVLFPNFSKINRDTPKQLKASLSKSKRWLSLLVMPITGVIMSWSQFIIDFMYDDRYSEAGWMMELLLLRVATACLLIPNALVLMAKGLPKYGTFSAMIKAIFIFIALPLASNYGTKEMILVIGLSGLINIPILWWALIKNKLFSLKIEVFSILLLLIGFFIGSTSFQLLH